MAGAGPSEGVVTAAVLAVLGLAILVAYARNWLSWGPLVWLVAAWVVGRVEASRARALLEGRFDRLRAEADRAKRGVLEPSFSNREKRLMKELDARMWLDSVCRVIYDKYEEELSRGLKDILAPILADFHVGPVRTLVLKKFRLGKPAPEIRRVVAVRLDSRDEIELELDVCHLGSGVDVTVAARLGGAWVGVAVPLALRAVSLAATIRVKVVLTRRAPFVDVLEVAFTSVPPTFDFSLRVVLLDVTGLPNVAHLLKEAIMGALQQMIAPKSLVLPLAKWIRPQAGKPEVCESVLIVHVIRGLDLPAGDIRSSDPYVVVNRISHKDQPDRSQTTVKPKTLRPVWVGERLGVRVHNPAKTVVEVTVVDYDAMGSDDDLATAAINSQTLATLLHGRDDDGDDDDSERGRLVWRVIASSEIHS